MTDKPEPTAEHIDDAAELAAAMRALQDHRGPKFVATRTELGEDGNEYPVAWDATCRCGVVTENYETHLLESIVAAVHAAQAANLPTDVMLTALVERGALTWQHDDREWRGDPGLIPRGRNNGVRWAACRVVSAWEPDEATP